MADPFAAYVQPEHEDGDPFAAHLAPAPHDPDDDVDTGPPTGAAARRFTPGAFDSEVSKLNAARAQLAPDGRNFLHRAADSVVHGVKAVAHVGSDVAHHPLDTLKDPAKRRELERGIDDMVTLGYGQKLAEHVTGDPLLSAEQESRDAAAAPDYRTAGNAVGAFTPGAASEIGKGAGKLVDLAVPAGVGGVAGNAARAVGAYEVAAPTTAALSANAAGDRLHAAREAATDPAGLVMSGLGGVGGREGARTGRAEGRRSAGWRPHARLRRSLRPGARRGAGERQGDRSRGEGERAKGARRPGRTASSRNLTAVQGAQGADRQRSGKAPAARRDEPGHDDGQRRPRSRHGPVRSRPAARATRRAAQPVHRSNHGCRRAPGAAAQRPTADAGARR